MPRPWSVAAVYDPVPFESAMTPLVASSTMWVELFGGRRPPLQRSFATDEFRDAHRDRKHTVKEQYRCDRHQPDAEPGVPAVSDDAAEKKSDRKQDAGPNEAKANCR